MRGCVSTRIGPAGALPVSLLDLRAHGVRESGAGIAEVVGATEAHQAWAASEKPPVQKAIQLLQVEI